MLKQRPSAYLKLFLVSAPTWWLFEVLNWRTQNWHYDGREFFTDLQYFLLASLSFSTVIPAVFSTAELVITFDWLKRFTRGPTIVPTRTVLLRAFVGGWLMLLLLVLWPRYFFPFLWLSLYFIIEPVNLWLKRRSIASYVGIGDWRPLLALWIGCLICSFFWEMWNFYSYPKWIYRIPFVSFLHVFEMPELFALYQLVTGMLGEDRVRPFRRLESR
jgi:hypothetical protein